MVGYGDHDERGCLKQLDGSSVDEDMVVGRHDSVSTLFRSEVAKLRYFDRNLQCGVGGYSDDWRNVIVYHSPLERRREAHESLAHYHIRTLFGEG